MTRTGPTRWGTPDHHERFIEHHHLGRDHRARCACGWIGPWRTARLAVLTAAADGDAHLVDDDPDQLDLFSNRP